MELHKWLWCDDNVKTHCNASLSEIQTIADAMPQISKKNGFYFLLGKEKNIATRQQRYLIAEKKFKKRALVLRLLCLMPQVKMLGICNSLAFSNAREESDIDIFIITEKNKIYTARLFTAGLLSLFRLRPNKNKTKNTLCLSFFADSEHLNMEKLQCLPNDIYLKYWVTQIFPMYDAKNYFQSFIEANVWIKKFLPNWLPKHPVYRRRIELSGLEKFMKKILSLFSFESFYKKIQLKILSPELKKMQNKDTRVIISDSILKLYPLDRREKYFKEWENRCLTSSK
ncbi:MAG: hypothetical protein WC752_02225 [Patescibacteria group bacterium]